MKLLIITDRQPWFDDKPHDKGVQIEIEDAEVAKAFLDNDFAVELAAEDEAPKRRKKPAAAAPTPAEPAGEELDDSTAVAAVAAGVLDVTDAAGEITNG